MSEFESGYHPENERNPETVIEELHAEARRFGFVESQEMGEIRTRIIREPSRFKEFLAEWKLRAEDVTNTVPDDISNLRARLGMNLIQAAIWLELGDYDMFLEKIADLRGQANRLGQDALADHLSDLLGE